MTKVRFKEFKPKPGDPGTIVTADGRDYEVWSLARKPRTVWAMPVEARDGDAAIYLVSLRQDSAEPYHADGTRCGRITVWDKDPEQFGTSIMNYHTEPCNHRSHR